MTTPLQLGDAGFNRKF